MYDMPWRRYVLKKMGSSQPTLTIKHRQKILFPSLKFLMTTGPHYSLQNLQRGSREIQQEPAKDKNTCVVLICSTYIQLFATLRTVAHQAPLSMGFSRQECWSELPCPPSRGSSQIRSQTAVCLLHWQVGFFLSFFLFLPLAAWEAYKNSYVGFKKKKYDVRVAN